MGGYGSGRIAEQLTVAELLMNDEQFSELVRCKTVGDYQTVLDMLMRVIRGELHDEVLDSKNGVMIKRSASLADRVKAAKVWKEMTLDKIIADKKTIGDGDQGNLLDYLSTLDGVAQEIAAAKREKARQVEHTAEATGKLARIGAAS